MSSNIQQSQIGLPANMSNQNRTQNSQVLNYNNFAYAQSNIRWDSQNQPSQINNPTGSQLLKQQQFCIICQQYVIDEGQQQSQIKQQQQSKIQLAQSDIRGGNFYQSQIVNSGYDANMLQSKPFQGSQEQQIQQRSNLPNSNSNIIITDNWTENDYAKQFEEWRDLIQLNKDFISQLENDRLQIPLSNVIVQEILKIKSNILKNSLISKLTQFNEIIKPFSYELSNKSEELEQSLGILKQSRKPPKNKFATPQQEQQSALSNVQLFNQQLSHVKLEIQNQINLTNSILQQISGQKNYIEPQENYQQKLENAFSSQLLYVRERMTQSINLLLFIHEREVFNLDRQINSQIQESDTLSITSLLEKLMIIEGLLEKFYEKKQELREFKERLTQLQNRNIDLFSDFFEDVESLYKQYKIYYVEIKQIQQISNQPILQNLQIKIKQQLSIAAKQVWLDIKQLYFNGNRIKDFNEEEKFQLFNQYNIEAQVQYIKSYVNQLQIDYLKKGNQVPLEESKKLKQLIYKAESQYQKTNQIRQEISLLEQQEFIAYRNYITDNVKPRFFVDFKELYAKDFYEVIHFQYADASVLETTKQLLQFKFPTFDWNENIDDERQRIEIIMQRHDEVSVKLQGLAEQYSSETKFVKQLRNWKGELLKCINILKQYLVIKEQLKGEIITLLKWPQTTQNMQKINEFSVHCEQISRQANQYFQAIEQLQSMQLIDNLQLLFNKQNQTVKQYLIEQCNFINQREFSPIINDQMQIVYQFLYACMECLNFDIDEVFCRTTTYQEFENILSGSTKLQELKNVIDGNVHNSALRYKLFQIIDNFMKNKIKQDFQNLFELKIQQSKQDTNNFNPKELEKRTDLKFPINRPDICENSYCKLNMDLINQIIDQPDLRYIFSQFRDLLTNITAVIDQDISVTDIQINQITILELANNFSNQLLIQNQLTNIQPLIRFHQQLSQFPSIKQFQNQLINLGIVFPAEYNKYLAACQRRVQRLVQNFDEISQAKLYFNNNEYILTQIDFPYLYIDSKSLILEYQPLKFNCSLNVKINGKVLKTGSTIQI
ncbi:unnamed protein product (macronuclear) [Paramecium tetraurelia]|uniref:Dynein heavy chain linker domain-containing protein n=1 Tax=Paramecium tetraurelia TaxID=5888 RepID=A0CG08_PARTE|nr:uncharacterized protein GSPATT00038168001 [Paramecium tetraurelia]CAK69725.1 unnamed protein product [Paramecium tetraurelia]|eukprot:XP_001437122.1 hypothetical protein (macronuclear) [Paramecium tetraurelia strain d4-2]